MEVGESQERHTFSVIAALSGFFEHCLWIQSLHFRGGSSLAYATATIIALLPLLLLLAGTDQANRYHKNHYACTVHENTLKSR